VILCGKELLLQHEETASIIEAARSAHGEVDVFRFGGGEVTPAEVLDECRSFGLIAAHKVVVVDEAEQLVQAPTRPMFERYAQNPSAGATLVLRSGNWSSGNLDKMVDRVVKCVELKDHEAIAWVGRRAAERHGVKIERDAASELVERVGPGLGRLDSELGKLAIGAEGGVVRRGQVEGLIPHTKTLEPWPLQEALLSGSAEAGIGYIRRTIETAPRGVEIPLIFSATTLARDLHACAVAQQLRLGIDEVARRTEKRNAWGLKQVYPRGSRLRVSDTAALVAACVRADAGAKSGGRADRSLEVLAVRFASVVR
jgi:DNA polymerase III delta subunit